MLLFKNLLTRYTNTKTKNTSGPIIQDSVVVVHVHTR